MTVYLGFLFMLDNLYHSGKIPEFIGRRLCDHYESFFK